MPGPCSIDLARLPQWQASAWAHPTHHLPQEGSKPT
jgi:hypothetical protein